MAIESTPRSTSGYQGGGQRPPYAGRPGMKPGMGSSSGAGSMGKGGRPPFRQRLCRVCEEKKGHVDWKAFNYLRNFMTDRGKILAGRSKAICAKCQRNLAVAIKRAQNMALLPTSPIY